MSHSTKAPRAFVIGHPIGHSRSPMLHGHWLKSLGLAGSYEACDVAPEALESFFDGLLSQGFVGGNVTVPHKRSVMKYLTRIDSAADAIGAVNTIWRDNGDWVGGNTDAEGFIANLDASQPGWDQVGKTVVMLGAGGAARAAIYGLKARGFHIHVVNRTLLNALELAAYFGPAVTAHGWGDLPDLLPLANVLVNTTALGMQAKPPLSISIEPLKPGALVYDIVYVPLETALLRHARENGHRTVDGLGMLLHQAVAGFAHWYGQTPTVTRELRQLLESDIRSKTGT